jgi:hypothetical protein
VIDLRQELLGRVKRTIEALDPDERAAEAATGDLGNKPTRQARLAQDAHQGELTKQRYTVTVGRAFEKLRQMVERLETDGAERQ